MKQFILDRHTVPGSNELYTVTTPKIPVYDDLDAAEGDFSNLHLGQLVATKDVGVYGSNSYSTTEKKTGGKWIDGKPIYRKTIDCGALPNATNKTVNHNIANIDKVINQKGWSYNGDSFFPLPYVFINASYQIKLFATKTQIQIETGSDRSGFTETYVTLEYTKTTD